MTYIISLSERRHDPRGEFPSYSIAIIPGPDKAEVQSVEDSLRRIGVSVTGTNPLYRNNMDKYVREKTAGNMPCSGIELLVDGKLGRTPNEILASASMGLTSAEARGYHPISSR